MDWCIILAELDCNDPERPVLTSLLQLTEPEYDAMKEDPAWGRYRMMIIRGLGSTPKAAEEQAMKYLREHHPWVFRLPIRRGLVAAEKNQA